MSPSSNKRAEIEKTLRARFRGQSDEQLRLIEALTEAVHVCHLKGWGDASAFMELRSENASRYRQRISEVLVFNFLRSAGLSPVCSPDGPDFLIEKDGKKIWIELITPTPEGLPDEWNMGALGQAIDVPNDKILLRWTHAIDEKAKKLNGRLCSKTGDFKPGYLQKKIVGPQDAYVIAVNGLDLRGYWNFPNLHGISQYPFAVEAAFGVGPIQTHIDRKTLKSTHTDHQIRDSIPKPNGRTVPVGTFINSGLLTQNEFRRVSAVWALDIDETYTLGHDKPAAVVHNPIAEIPIGEMVLPAFEEYVCLPQEEGWQMNRRAGSLQREKSTSN